MSKPKKYNKCPYCKSDKGFMVVTRLGGYQYDSYTFSGDIIHSDRQGTDDVENYVECLNCNKFIPLENIRYEI